MFEKQEVQTIAARLREPRRFIQVVTGPRQVGKTTAVEQARKSLPCPSLFFSADMVTEGAGWIRERWQEARLAMTAGKASELVLVLDEIQKIANWSEAVKREWDADTREQRNLKVVLCGSSRVMLGRDLSESLAGRFEEIRMTHWTFPEMRQAFGYGLDEFVLYGGYPGAAALIGDSERWRQFILGTIVDATINRDILVDAPVGKPALLRRTFELGSQYSGQIVSVTKLMGELQDAGNTTTLSGYLERLGESGLLTGLRKYSADAARRRASIPKFQVHNNALFTVQIDIEPSQARLNRALWGRFVESAVGAWLVSQCFVHRRELLYWRERADEVDFVLKGWGKTVAIEVKSNCEASSRGLMEFSRRFHPDKAIIVGEAGLPLEDLLSLSLRELCN